ncbi:MAG: hypothetical protein EP329_28780 [Deltaproteobacteria bacterium]|nr:MAG: hypothetical protein EP329_28780 [Deltaproteobacteria bacterium]
MALFLGSAEPVEVPRPGAAHVTREAIPRGEPLRSPLTDPPIVHVNGYDRDCMDCHMLFRSPAPKDRGLIQHQNVVFQHGINARCLECHDQADRNRLTLGHGETIGFTESERLCAKCHGTAFRDWQAGAHGKAVGSWVIGSPERHLMTCVACHDPHHPAFAGLTPLPGPNTLRMGDQSHHAPEHESAILWRGAHPEGTDRAAEPADAHAPADAHDPAHGAADDNASTPGEQR